MFQYASQHPLTSGLSRRRIQLFRNAVSEQKPISTVVPETFAQLLDICTEKLNLRRRARLLFSYSGKPLLTLRDIKDGMQIFVSCGEDFAGLRSPVRVAASSLSSRNSPRVSAFEKEFEGTSVSTPHSTAVHNSGETQPPQNSDSIRHSSMDAGQRPLSSSSPSSTPLSHRGDLLSAGSASVKEGENPVIYTSSHHYNDLPTSGRSSSLSTRQELERLRRDLELEIDRGNTLESSLEALLSDFKNLVSSERRKKESTNAAYFAPIQTHNNDVFDDDPFATASPIRQGDSGSNDDSIRTEESAGASGQNASTAHQTASGAPATASCRGNSSTGASNCTTAIHAGAAASARPASRNSDAGTRTRTPTRTETGDEAGAAASARPASRNSDAMVESSSTVDIDFAQTPAARRASESASPPSIRKVGRGFSKLSKSQKEVLLRIREAVRADANISSGELVSAAFSEMWQNCTSEVRLFLQSFVDMEENGRILYFEAIMSSLIEQSICPSLPDRHLCFPETILSYLREVLERQIRVINNERSLAHLCVAVLGPRRSGKTTLVYLLCRLAARLFLNNGQWKKVFVFSVNWSHLLQMDKSMEAFYYRFVDTLFASLCKQKASLVPYKSGLILFFRKIISQKSIASLPQEFVRRHCSAAAVFRSYSQRMLVCWHETSNLDEFLRLTFGLPRYVSEAFCFHDVLFIADHFDAANVTLCRDGGSLGENSLRPVSSFAAQGMANSMLIVSCVDPQSMMNCFSQDPETEVLLDSIEAIDTTHLVADDTIRSLYPELPADIQVSSAPVDDASPHADGLSSFLGCPAYLARLLRAYRLDPASSTSSYL
ncbi:putative mitochondrial protein [Andalucia godoyi]|uniref:Putative mitochondrial protein n=1 Tax=Andalucia godoyi TaxID=505711 RepID=A0A8K0AGZ5_ANDGO|nr:putative mitochondrial protein [Andalucia godoyi]|eukprot:ANDGO_07717.mRNA.1 putative mitochondrial protein